MPSPPRLPTPGGDDDSWGDILNQFLEVSLDNPNGTLKSAAVSAAGAEMITNKDTDGALAANSDTKYPSQKATKTYVDAKNAAQTPFDDTTTTTYSLSGTNVQDVTDSIVTNFALALNSKENLTNKDTDGTLAANSDTNYPSQKATKTYVDTQTVVASSPNLQGSVGVHMRNLDGWYSKYADVVKGTGRAKVLVIGDSISSFYGVRSWPGLLHGLFQSHRITQGDGSVLGSRFPNSGSASTNTTTTTTAGTYTMIGAGAQSAIMASGNEFTQTFSGDAVTIIYGTGAAAGSGTVGGTISVYDGPSSGTAVATVDASLGGTKYSQLLDVTGLALGNHTITVKVTGGTGTLIEQVVPHAGTLTQGVDLRTCARFGFQTAHYLDSADPNSSQSGGVSNSHALALIQSWQPDLIINTLGQNDNLLTTWQTNTTSLYNSIFALAPNTNILTAMMYATNNTNTRGGWIDAAETIAATHAGKVETLSLPLMMGTLDKTIQQYGSQLTTDNGIHPTYVSNNMMMFSIAMKLTGDPLAIISNLPAILPNMNVTWTGNVIGNVTGNVTGQLSGTVSRPIIAVTGSRTIDNTTEIGKIFYYNGSTDITLTLSTAGNILAPLASATDVWQLGTGKITVDVSAYAGAGFPLAGPNTTVSAGDRLSFRVLTSPNLTAFARQSATAAGVTTPRVNTLTAASNVYTINTDTTDLAIINSPSANFTVTVSGTPVDGQKVQLRVVNGATVYTPTWNTIFASSGLVTLPTAYTASKTNMHGFVYDANKSKWVLMALDPAGY